ncbi:uncharacterized protein ACA1_264900 [Acanthamoeba castellanii str. Neff]|uniref:Uncharacterized protein n=1 Tax=Acanthamoeba castellanii (strain ATCC 30010 / Neff) TaxID=1257118 RepID=L8H4C4_ACACF|nr:uncharacterized protein ACA1_264900 [Acanthamoeba castellanii str. Neff]ELR19316.1 hypothetical protein ACA1_264900 [Acanthamoeba castellanii str. Neff]
MSSPVSAAEFQQLKEAFNTLAKRIGKEKVNDEETDEPTDEHEPEKDGSPRAQERSLPVNLDALDPELESQFDNIKHLANGHAAGLTKFPSNKGNNFSKEDKAHVAQLQKCYKALKVVIRICVTGVNRHPKATNHFDTALTAALWGIHSILTTHQDLYFKGVMGNNFKIWRSLNARGVSAKEHKLAVEAMQFSATITMAKPRGHVNTSLNSAKYTNNNNHQFNPSGQHQKNRRGGRGTSSGAPALE